MYIFSRRQNLIDQSVSLISQSGKEIKSITNCSDVCLFAKHNG